MCLFLSLSPKPRYNNQVQHGRLVAHLDLKTPPKEEPPACESTATTGNAKTHAQRVKKAHQISDTERAAQFSVWLWAILVLANTLSQSPGCSANVPR